jgi:hypothetical protein
VGVVVAPALVDPVVVAQELDHPELGNDQRLDDVAHRKADLRHGAVVLGVHHQEKQGLAADLVREDLVASHEGLGQERHRLGMDLARLHRHRRHAVGPCERLPKALFGDEA